MWIIDKKKIINWFDHAPEIIAWLFMTVSAAFFIYFWYFIIMNI